MADIGSSGVIFTLSVPLIIPVPQRIQGFANDDAFDFPEIDINETLMGLDGKLSGGFVFMEQIQKVMLQADSPSNAFFDAWASGMRANGAVFVGQGVVSYPNNNSSYTLLNGYLKNYKPAPDAKRLLQPRSYTIMWERMNLVPVGVSG